MGIPWNQTTRRTGRLLVRIGASTTGSPWDPIIREAIREFNTLSGHHHLGVAFDLQSGPTGACEVMIETGNGSISAEYGGRTTTTILDGTSPHGKELTFHSSGYIEKTFIFLPANPMASATRAGGGRAPVGPGPKRFIAIHEMIHACGLTNEDHSTDDVFHGFPDILCGSRPADDRVTFYRGGRLVQMPPIDLMPGTVGHIRALWT